MDRTPFDRANGEGKHHNKKQDLHGDGKDAQQGNRLWPRQNLHCAHLLVSQDPGVGETPDGYDCDWKQQKEHKTSCIPGSVSSRIARLTRPAKVRLEGVPGGDLDGPPGGAVVSAAPLRGLACGSWFAA